MERAQVVICADSFAGHAGPLFGCTTLVIANAGLENWRVPLPGVYYFAAEAPIESVIAGMRQVLDRLETRRPPDPDVKPRNSAAEWRLERSTRRLERLFEVPLDSQFHAVCSAYRGFASAYRQVVGHLAEWSGEFGSLFADVPYADQVRVPIVGDEIPADLRPDVMLHLLDDWQKWQNTNLRKYLGLVLGEARA
jgi:hypothetical protein